MAEEAQAAGGTGLLGPAPGTSGRLLQTVVHDDRANGPTGLQGADLVSVAVTGGVTATECQPLLLATQRAPVLIQLQERVTDSEAPQAEGVS